MEFHHTSVLLNETIDNLNIRPDGIYVDGTLGGGGHALEVAKRLGEGGRLIGIDQDARCDSGGNRETERVSGSCDHCSQQLLQYASGTEKSWN